MIDPHRARVCNTIRFWEGEAPAEPLLFPKPDAPMIDPHRARVCKTIRFWEGEAPAEPLRREIAARREPRPPD